jgi:hypothetical protein
MLLMLLMSVEDEECTNPTEWSLQFREMLCQGALACVKTAVRSHTTYTPTVADIRSHTVNKAPLASSVVVSAGVIMLCALHVVRQNRIFC